MKRTKKTDKKSPNAILSADIHLSESPPISRTDNYLETQSKKLKFLRELQAKYKCPVLDAGDIFSHWKPSPWLLSKAHAELPDNLYTIPGNHDLPEHSIKLYYKSGLAVLEEVGTLTVFPGLNDASDRIINSNEFLLYVYAVPYNGNLDGIQVCESVNPDCRILIIHDTVWPGVKPP